MIPVAARFARQRFLNPMIHIEDTSDATRHRQASSGSAPSLQANSAVAAFWRSSKFTRQQAEEPQKPPVKLSARV